jgi:hypothetical protein
MIVGLPTIFPKKPRQNQGVVPFEDEPEWALVLASHQEYNQGSGRASKKGNFR